MEQQNRPKIGMGVYIINDKHQILLTLRRGSHEGGTWCPPGGHLEIGESFFTCAKREVKEEVDLDNLPQSLMLPVINLLKENPEVKNKLISANSFVNR